LVEAIQKAAAANAPAALFALIPMALAIYLYVRGRRLQQPCWAIHTSMLVEDYQSRVPGLEIAYKGEHMESVEVSRILFWNAGRETIRSADLESVEPIKVVASDDLVVLDVVVLTDNIAFKRAATKQPGSAGAANFSVTRSDDGWLIKFPYLDYGRGAVLQVVHTSSQHQPALSVTGSLIGGAKLQRRRDRSIFVLDVLLGGQSRNTYRFGRVIQRLVTVGPLVAGLIVVAAGVIVIADPKGIGAIAGSGDRSIGPSMLLAGALYAAAGGWMAAMTRFTVPAGLEVFGESVF
jgi:hypothetical protein